jgi:hypothetical protein
VIVHHLLDSPACPEKRKSYLRRINLAPSLGYFLSSIGIELFLCFSICCFATEYYYICTGYSKSNFIIIIAKISNITQLNQWYYGTHVAKSPKFIVSNQKNNTRGLQLSIRRVTPEVLTQEICITWTLWLSHLSPQQVLHNKFASLEPYGCQLHLSSLQVSHSNSASLEAYHCQFYLPSKKVLHNKSASLGP